MADGAPLTIRLELARAEDTGDPHAFRTGPQDYILRWEGGAFEQARLVWDDALQQDLADVRLPGRDPELVRRIGARLQRFLEPTRFRDQAAQIQAAALAGRPVHLDIVSAAAELYSLPWELLTLEDGRHLGELPDLVLQYRWPGALPTPPTRAPRPEGGRLFFAWSRAFGGVGEAQTLDAVAAAARAGFVAFDRERDVLQDMSLAGLVAALEQRVAGPDPPAVLHLLAHGAPIGRSYGLGLDDGRGGREVVDSAALRRALAPFAAHLRLVVVMACDGGNPGPLGALLGSCVQELHRAGFEAVVGSRFPLAGAAALEFTGAFYTGLLERTCSVDQAFVAARARLARGSGLDWASLMLHGHARPGRGGRPVVFRPHRGLLAFEREHARFFFGRDVERREAIADLQRLIADKKPRFLVVAGASGTGKSSVVLAGVVPDVEALGWATAVLRPGRTPMRTLDEALALRPRDGRPCLLVVDQFEEIFTHADASDGDPGAFARRLWELSQSTDDPTRVIVTLRVDYLGRCGEVVLDAAGLRLDKIAYDEAHRLFVAQMSPERLAETIAGPLARVGLSLEAGLDRRLLDEIGGDPIGLPLLQYALDELWKRRADDTLTHAALDAIGGVVGALAHHADAAVDALPPDGQAQARRLLVRLVAYGADPSSGTRRRELEADLLPARDAAAFARAAAALIDARLLVRRTEADGRVTLEVAHEALIRHWARLWGWYEQDRATLARHRELAEITDQATQHRELLTGNLLAAAEALVHALGDDVDPDARAVVQQSRAAADRAARRLRWLRVAGLAALLATLAVVLVSRQNVARQAARAERAKQRSTDIALIATAFAQSYDRPHLSAALLREVEDTTLPQWRQTAFTTSLALPPAAIDRPPATGGPAPVTAAALVPGGAELLTGHADGAVRLWPLGPEGQERSLLLLRPGEAGPDRAIEHLDVRADPAGPTLLATSRTTLHAWRRAAGRVTPLLARTDLPATGAAHYLGPGDLLATWTDPRGFGGARLDIARLDGAPVHTLEGCAWLDPSAALAACGDREHNLRLRGWSGEDIGPLAATDLGPTVAAATARLFRSPLADEAANLYAVDPVGRRIGTLYSAALLDAGNLFWLEPSPDTLCRLRRGADVSSCGALPATCGGPRLLATHPELGALIQCRSGEPRLLLVDATAERRAPAEPEDAAPAELAPLSPAPVADLRLELAAPDAPIVGAFLDPDGARLVAVTRDNQLWRWDLRDPPSGWLAHVTRTPAVAALVHGTSSLLELAPTDAGAELRLLRWADPTLPPAITAVPLPNPDAPTPGGLVADAGGYLGVQVSPFALTAVGVETEVSVFWGSLPPTAPPRRRAADMASGLFPDLPLAAHPAAAVVPIDDGYALLDLAPPAAAPRTLRAPPLRDDRLDRRTGAAFHPSGAHLVALWQQSPAALVDRTTGAMTPLAPAPGPGCGETDATSLLATAAAFSPDGRVLALGYATGRLELWPVRPDGRLDPAGAPRVLCRPRAPLAAIAFSPDGEGVVTSSASSNLTIWFGLSRPVEELAPLTFWLPGRPRLRDLTIGDGRLLLLTDTGHVWFSHATLDRDGLAARLGRSAALCLYQSERMQLLNEEPAAAAVTEAACISKHVLQDISPP